MYLSDLQPYRSQLHTLAARYGATRLRVFGSVARGDAKPNSDIDFLVDLPRGYDLFTQRLALQDDLERLLGRKVDLVPSHELNRHIAPYVLREAVDL
jgi:predicted nucleotidyltransferase